MWALEQDVSQMAGAIARASSGPLVVTGSGGSLTAADFACSLHQARNGQMARAFTPLDLVSGVSPRLYGTTTLILSAGGRNPDVLGAAGNILAREPRQAIVLCARSGTPLAALARKHDAEVFEFEPPSGKDGFLATNTLFAFMLLLHRSYGSEARAVAPLPPALQDLLGTNVESLSRRTEELCRPLWERETTIVLHGPSTRAAAIDLESKFTEAALGSIQIADYRNFAHGRHHWLAKRGSASGVLAIVSADDETLADRTLDILPRKTFPIARVPVLGHELDASLAALVQVMHITASAGAARGIDPGRPGVPPFGRKLYNLRTFGSPGRSWRDAAIERKTGERLTTLGASEEVEGWRAALDSFVDTLRSARIGAVVLDYDGTICDRRDRLAGIQPEVCTELIRLLDSGLLIGIATGRGKSVRADLVRHVKARQEHVWIGYYNGGYIRRLDQDLESDVLDGAEASIAEVQRAIEAQPWLNERVKVDAKRMQLSIVGRSTVPERSLWEAVEQVAARFGATVVRSSHSVDVLAPGVTKRALVQRMQEEVGADKGILCIGDRGRWPGNDHALLSEPLSLSVDEVSSDPSACWNLASPGVRGVRATLSYLQMIAVKNGTGRVSLPRDK